MPLEITEDNFQEKVEASPLPVLLDFWAEWCPPCRLIAPLISELADQYQGKVTIGKVDVDKNAQLAEKFSISSIPTLLVIHEGKVVTQKVGAIPKTAIEDMFKPLIG